MKILHAATLLSRNGLGVSKVVEELARCQMHAGNDVYVVGLKDKLFDKNKSQDWADINTSAHSILGPQKFGFSISYIFSIIQFDPDVVHVHGLWNFHNLAVLVARLFIEFEIIISPHGMLSKEALKISKVKKYIVNLLYQRTLLSRASSLHATNLNELSEIRGENLGANVYVVPNGVSRPVANQIRTSDDRKRIIYISRLHPKKGVDILVKAWSALASEYPGWFLQISGTGDEEYVQYIQRLIIDLDCNTIVLTGGIFSPQFELEIQKSEAFVLPSLSESWPLSVGQAMAVGSPIITTTGTPFGFLDEIGAGYCVEPSVEGLTNGLSSMMSVSSDERISMGIKAKAWVEENLNWDKISLIHLNNYLKADDKCLT